VREEDLLGKLAQWDQELEGDAGAEKKSGAYEAYKKYFLGGLILVSLVGIFMKGFNDGRAVKKKKVAPAVTAKEVESVGQKPGETISPTVDSVDNKSVQAKSEKPPATVTKKLPKEEKRKKDDNSKVTNQPTSIPKEENTKPTNPEDAKSMGKEPLKPNPKEAIKRQRDSRINIAFTEVDAEIDMLAEEAGVSTRSRVGSEEANQDSLSSEKRYELGLFNYQEKNFDNAIKYLEVFGDPANTYLNRQQARLALCAAYLRTGAFEQGESLLDEIIKADISDAAVELKAKLPELKEAFVD